MKTAFLVLLSLCCLLGCAKTAQTGQQLFTQNTDTTTKLTNKTTLQYLALGDSYTIGESVEPAQSFPYQLKTVLTGQGYTVADPRIIAVTGWTTTNLIDAIAQAKLTQKYDFVTLLIGVNNQYQGKSQAQYRTEFVQLLNTAITFANGNKKHVFVLSIPDYSVTPFAQNSDKAKIASEIDQFNDINLYESTNAGVNYLNITGISRQADTDPTLIAVDGLHPSAKMYSLWVAGLAPMVANNLK
ncbi:lysophospholipase [Mucilaginibacter sp. PPCGB 2223]|uniref:SGNH/GDSL hydrolase family protein n=1 Tax=Mucilaginibacter sp. PPCGB 2223 TaxID=1886027 RepID=UPI0008242852|nr:SGNH/GDSL hydrolase family protein [Mucilaginibacter sp. PPCGB 2223]OCX50755.1 lysophospholipase [Mucilaginibacter sp. PPCGB 2223]